MSTSTQTPALAAEIEEYIRQHSFWKNNILKAIQTGNSEHRPAEVALDNQCAFGKWLYSAGEEVRSNPHYQEVQRLHAAFHKQAAKTLADAVAGRHEQAMHDLEHGDYADATSALVLGLSRWKRGL